MTLDEANKLWYEFKPIEGVKFGLNDYVCIVSGKHSGNNGSVISLISLGPIIYLIELGHPSGGDVIIPESELEKVD